MADCTFNPRCCMKATPIKKDISVVIPIYFEEKNIPEFYRRIIPVLRNKMNLNYELIYVNDGSTDKSAELIKQLMEQDKNIRLIDLSRNFGHQVAVTAGVDMSVGEVVVIIDADLQDPPEMIEQLYEKYKEGYDVVYAQRRHREGETFFKLLTAKYFYRFINKISEVKMPLDTGDFRLISRRVADQLKFMPERDRFLRGLVSWVGFKQIGIPYDRDKRFAGKTGYPLFKMLRFSLDGITSFSKVPLRLITFLGFFMSFLSILFIFYVLYLRFFTERTAPGWSAIMIILSFIGGLILLSLGIIGEYLGRIFNESKGRPLYVVNEICESKPSKKQVKKVKKRKR